MKLISMTHRKVKKIHGLIDQKTKNAYNHHRSNEPNIKYKFDKYVCNYTDVNKHWK